ncbi:SurA N-terminal domain-containing protein [Evansella tamaricis]|uniref:peptidylprolyl isomerase n=1 Tax=Evansella tamaricis TaxID=2069301 RepID=A0ABS6JKU2_9BACI|nr:SurA N-terminal domain-containing protein [Evansella tamaricis]MBU9714283.1 SurA N-terminal domain-containing protein [Evansella tamaricis]
MSFIRRFLLTTSIVAILALAACGGDEQGDSEDNSQAGISEGETAATVNGENIYLNELDQQLNQIKELYAQQGLDLEAEENAEMLQELRRGILDEMVQDKILIQEANNQNIEPTEEEIDVAIEQVMGQYQMTEEELQEVLDLQNYTQEMFRSDIKDQLKIQQLLTLEHLDSSQLEVSDDELRDYYDEIVAQYGEEVGEYEELQVELEESFLRERYLENLTENAELEIFI